METSSNDGRIGALAQLLTIVIVFLLVREWARGADLIGAGSIAILAAVASGTLIVKLRGGSWAGLGLKRPAGTMSWIMIFGLAIATIAVVFGSVVMFIMPLAERLTDGPAEDISHNFSFFFGKPGVFALYMLGVVWIGAAFGEEMFSRGLMMNSIAELLGSTKLAWALALVGQAAFFGAAHAYQGTSGIIITGSIGLIFGVMYLVGRRNLWPLILAHGAIDTISLTQLYLANPVA